MSLLFCSYEHSSIYIFKISELTSETLCVAVARVGWPDQKIAVCTLEQMTKLEMGAPLHSLIIVGKVHPLEFDYLRMFNGNLVLPKDCQH